MSEPREFRFTAEMFADMGLPHHASGSLGPSDVLVARRANQLLDAHLATLQTVCAGGQGMETTWDEKGKWVGKGNAPLRYAREAKLWGVSEAETNG